MGSWFFRILILGEIVIVICSLSFSFGEALPYSDSAIAKATDAINKEYDRTAIEPVAQIENARCQAVSNILHGTIYFFIILLLASATALYSLKRRSNIMTVQRLTRSSPYTGSAKVKVDEPAGSTTYVINPKGSIQNAIQELDQQSGDEN